MSVCAQFPDIVHAGKPEPHNEIPQAQTAHDNFWDFISFTPESAHMIMYLLIYIYICVSHTQIRTFT